MPKLSLKDIVIQEHTPLGAVVIYELKGDKSEIKIGRASSNDIAIPEKGYRDKDIGIDKVALTMSREHCTIKYDGSNFTIYDKVGDKESTLGTYVNGEKVPEKGVVLKNKDKLKFGDYELEVMISEAESNDIAVLEEE